MNRSTAVALAALMTLVVATLPPSAAAQSPVPEILGTVDIRTTDGATNVGGPLEVLAGVLILGALTAAATFILVGLTERRSTHG